MEQTIEELADVIEDQSAYVKKLTKEIIELQGILENLAGVISYLTETIE